MVKYIPKRSDFIYLNFNPQAGHEQMGKRPALVISHTAFNKKMGFAFVCPISNTKRKNSFYVNISQVKSVSGVIMCDQLRSLDYNSRQASFICKCTDSLFEEVLMRIEPIIF
ncbi:transcriptional modulator of MazE/toxin, MazF [Candidatus Magnetomorum sp. HK-1]|nr:transcriptional modulator of MazE/toxin, MazF [Candidatus Magnetomorum sp. HK-1]